MNFQVQNSLLHAWQARVNRAPDGRSVLVASQLPLLHRAVLDQCDGLDGQLDGLLSDPRIADSTRQRSSAPLARTATSA